MLPADKERQTDPRESLTAAVQCCDWTQVVRLVHTKPFTDQQCRWAIEETVSRAPEKFVSEILDDCSGDHLDTVLPHILTRNLWGCAVRVLMKTASNADGGLTSELRASVGGNGDWAWWLLLLCFDDVLEDLLHLLVTEHQWESVGRILQLKIRQSQHIWAVEEAAAGFANPEEFVKYVLPHCLDEELGHALRYLVSERLWRHVDITLGRGTCSAQHRWVIEQASERADEEDFGDYILHHCSQEDLEQVLTRMVARGLWKPAHIATHTDASIKEHILSQLVSRHLWKAAGTFLQRGISSSQHRWAVEEGSKHVGYHYFTDFLLPQCCPEDLEVAITHLVSRGQWRSVDKALEREVSAARHRWAIEEALKRAGEESFAEYILHHCRNEDLELVLTHKLFHGLWQPAESVTLTDDNTMHQILSNIVSHDLWEAVGRFLEREISASHHRWAVEEAGRRAVDYDFVKYILPQCSAEELECAVTHLVVRAKWGAVGEAMAQGISPDVHTWVVEEACKQASDDDLVADILPHCHDEELEKGLTHIVSRGLMKSAGKVLERGLKTVQCRWVLEETAKSCSSERDLINHVLARCYDVDLEHVLACLVSQGLWMALGSVLQRGVSAAQRMWVLQKAAENAGDVEFANHIVRYCTEDNLVSVFPVLVATQKWTSVRDILQEAVCDVLYTWVTAERDSSAHDGLFWKLFRDCHVPLLTALDLTKVALKDVVPVTSYRLASRTTWKRSLCEVMVTSLSLTLCHVMLADDREYTDTTRQAKVCVSDIYSRITACVRDIEECISDNELRAIPNKEQWISVFTEMADSHKADPLFILHFLQGLNLYHISRRSRVRLQSSERFDLFSLGECDDDTFLVIVSVMPLLPQLQSAALRMMLREKRWDVISQACLTHVWEHDRRQLFKAALMQKQWRLVRRWADHTVHDDQRDWAMKEAFKEKQWMAYLLLAGHGLAMHEHMHAMYIVAKYGDWDTVLEMVERGGDITEVSNLLENWVTGNLIKKPRGDATVYFERWKKLLRLQLRFIRNSTLSPNKVLRNCMWGSVLFNIQHEPSDEYFSQVLHKVIEEEEWHILMHLVRLGMNATERDWLFPQMVRQQQWGVCIKLLEIGVDIQLCLEALPELMEKNQWMLVARVMEYNIDDAMRRQVMQYAFQRREGVLFWHCLNNMKNKEPLPVEVQRKLFHQALGREVWQAVKPLMVEKDGPRIPHRDMAFLEAIEQHLWDVVDHCQVIGADINMEDENGETPLHREARKEEWKAIEEIVFRDGKPNLLDKDGVSVLNRLICQYQSESAKFVIKYGANIHLPANTGSQTECGWSFTGKAVHTPLQHLIDIRQVDVIEMTLLWCPDQWRAVNDAGETTLHAACISGSWEILRFLVARRVDPLALTKAGYSALAYAVLSMRHPEKVVAECSRLGFSMRQPSLTRHHRQLTDIVHNAFYMWRLGFYHDAVYLREAVITSPLVCAVLRDLPAVVLMLFDSGSCSRADLNILCSQLEQLLNFDTEEWEDQHMIGTYFTRPRPMSHQLRRIILKYTALLQRTVTTPRTLLSSCRLLITPRLTLHKKRKWHIGRMRVPKGLKKYLEFSDFFDPDFGKDMLLCETDSLQSGP